MPSNLIHAVVWYWRTRVSAWLLAPSTYASSLVDYVRIKHINRHDALVDRVRTYRMKICLIALSDLQAPATHIYISIGITVLYPARRRASFQPRRPVNLPCSHAFHNHCITIYPPNQGAAHIHVAYKSISLYLLHNPE